MSTARLIIKPYYNKWDTPDLQNRFQKAVFNGRTTKVKQLIAAGENVYVSTDADESPLFIAIVRDYEAIVNQIIDIYEEDFNFIVNFFQSRHNINWAPKAVFAAHGSDHIALVKELSSGMEVMPNSCLDMSNTTVILLKSLQEKEILWLRPNSNDDNGRIAKIIECIWADGVIDFQHKGHWGRTVLDVAAIRYQPETYYRLFVFSRPEPEKTIEHFLQMCRHRQDQLEFFKHLWSKAAYKFDIADILLKSANVLVLPAYYDQIEIFYYFLECVADRTGTAENRQTIMNDILNTHKVNGDSTLMETIVWADNKEFVKQCLLRFEPNLLLIGANNETVLQSLIRQKPSEFITQFIVEHFDQVLACGMEYKIVKRLIKQNWLDAIKTLYSRYESCRSFLFRNKKKGVKCLLNAIDGCRYNLANYLVDAHRLDLTDTDDVTQMLLYCSFVERSNDVLQTLLSLPAANPLRITGEEHFYKSPIYVSLKFRHLKNYQLLMANVSDRQGLHDLKENNGENLLFVAIWFKENPVDETPFVYVEEEQASLEIVDSSDDDDELHAKRLRNEELLTSTGPYKDPIMPDSYFEKERIEFSRIFDYLLNELGLDHKCVNNVGETLLHVGVKRDNYDVVKQLLSIGLDLSAKDSAGNFPVHGVRSVGVLNLLRDYKCDINVVNLTGETPLLAYVKGIMADDNVNKEEQETFIIELLKAGADIYHADENGLTVLHITKNVKIVQILLEHGAAINAKNKDGETPILYVFREQMGAQNLYKVLLCHNGLDIMAVSAGGVSVLSVLVSLDDKTMTEVLVSFGGRSDYGELEDLFLRHCNCVDHFDTPVLVTACSEHTNSYCLDKLLHITHVDPNVYPEYQPLVASVGNHHTVQQLIDLGANVNGVGEAERKTPLMHAIGDRTSKSNFATIAKFLAAGADLEVLDQNGDSALNYACRLENLKNARRAIAALILANANYHRRTGEDDKLPLVNVEPFQCFFYDENTNI